MVDLKKECDPIILYLVMEAIEKTNFHDWFEMVDAKEVTFDLLHDLGTCFLEEEFNVPKKWHERTRTLSALCVSS